MALKLFAGAACFVAAIWGGAAGVTISGLTNSPDPFNNKATPPANVDTITFTVSGNDDARISIYNSAGTELKRRLYSNVTAATTTTHYWMGLTDPIPAYAAADTLAYGTYLIRARATMATAFDMKIEGSNIEINDLWDVAVDTARNIYFCDQFDGMIQKIDTLGNLLIKIDMKAPPLNVTGCELRGLTVDDSLNIFVADRGNDRITKLHKSSNYTTATLTWNTSPTSTDPYGLGTDGKKVWLADLGDGRVCEYDSAGNRIRYARVASCTDVDVDKAGYYYVCELQGTDEIRKFRTSDDALVTYWTAIDATSQPGALCVDRTNSKIYVAGTASDEVYSYNLDGTGATRVGHGSGTDTAFFDGPTGVAVIPAYGKVAITDRNNSRLQLLNTSDGSFDTLILTDVSNLTYAEGFGLDLSGNLYVATSGLGQVKKYRANGVYMCTIGSQGSGNGQFNDPRGVAVDDSGHIYVSDYGNNRVQRLTRTDSVTYAYQWQYAVTQPTAITRGPDGVLYVIGRGVNSVYKLSTAGALIDEILDNDMEGNPGGQQVSIVEPSGIAVDFAHNIYVVDRNKGDIYLGTIQNASNLPSSYYWTRIVNTANQLSNIAVDATRAVYVTDALNDNVQVYSTTGSSMHSWGTPGTEDGQFDDPRGVAIPGDGSAVWVADRNNHRMQKFAVSFGDSRDELVTIGDPSGPPTVGGVSFRRTADDSTLMSPLSDIHNSVSGDSGVTFVVTFSEAMDTTLASIPTVTLQDINSNNHPVDPRAGAGFTNGWLKTSTNVWKGWLNIPSGNDGLATIYVQNAKDEFGSGMSPSTDGSNTVNLDTETPVPTINSPAAESNTMESILTVSGTAEANATLTVSNYTAASGGSLISQQTGVSADGGGSWAANSITLAYGNNYLTAVARDGSGNQSTEVSPRVHVTRTNISPGTIAISPTTEVAVGDSSQWTFTYTAASTLDDGCYVKVGTPPGWSDPQMNDSTVPGYVRATAGAGATLDATPVAIVNIDTIRVNIASMTNGTQFTLQYGHNLAAGYAKATSSVSCGTNTFGSSLNDTLAITPPSLFVRARPLGVSHVNAMPESTLVGQSDLLVMKLAFDNSTGLKNKKVTKIVLHTERSTGTDVNANLRLSALRIKKNTTTLGSVAAGSSSLPSITLSTPLEIGAGGRDTVLVRVDVKNDAALYDSTFRVVLLDSTRVTASEVASATSVVVKSAGGDAFPQVSTGTRLYQAVAPDSLLVSSQNLMPATAIGELEADVSALRILLKHPSALSGNIDVTRIEFTMTPTNPSTVVARKVLRRKGATSNLFSSSTIETANPMVFDLSLSPIVISPAAADTIDVLFDGVASPAASVQFTITASSNISAEDGGSATAVPVKGNGVSFPLASGTGTITSGTATPSGKDVTGTLADWDLADEQIETSNTSEAFYATWDNNNVYFVWKGRNLATNGDLFLYLSTGAGGSSSTWDYSSYGTHYLSSGFNGANYVAYYDNSSAKGLRNGASSYAAATFNGSMVAVGDTVEIRIPLSDIGNPDTIRVIPVIQAEGSAEILASMPDDGVGEFVRNPTGYPTQTFISWMRLPVVNKGATPVSVATLDSATIVKPSWSYSLGAGNYAVAITVGYYLVYISVDGTQPKMVCLGSDGSYNWAQNFASAPTACAVYYDTLGGANKDVLIFGEGNNLRAGYDNVSSFVSLSWSPKAMGAKVGTPSRSIPPDGRAYDTVFAYVPVGDGKLYKILAIDGSQKWATAAINANPKAGLAVQSDRVFVACTDGYVRSYDISGGALNALDVGDSINERLSYVSSLGTVYCAPKDNNVVALNTNLTSKWTLDIGATTYAAPYCETGTNPAKLFCPAGNYLRHVQDNTTSGGIVWTYQTTNTINTDPVSLGSVVYFSSDDRRNFAVNMTTGANISGWPSAVLEGESRSRVVVDGLTQSLYFGGGDAKVYRYPKQ